MNKNMAKWADLKKRFRRGAKLLVTHHMRREIGTDRYGNAQYADSRPERRVITFVGTDWVTLEVLAGPHKGQRRTLWYNSVEVTFPEMDCVTLWARVRKVGPRGEATVRHRLLTYKFII